MILLITGKKVEMSSVKASPSPELYTYDGENVVDGIYSPLTNSDEDVFASVAMTENEFQPWLMINLEDIYLVYALRVLNFYSDSNNLM